MFACVLQILWQESIEKRVAHAAFIMRIDTKGANIHGRSTYPIVIQQNQTRAAKLMSAIARGTSSSWDAWGGWKTYRGSKDDLLMIPMRFVAKRGAIRSFENFWKNLARTSPGDNLVCVPPSGAPPISFRISSVSQVFRLFEYAMP